MLTKLKALWKSHGTKILGHVTGALSALAAFMAYLSGTPGVAFMLSHKQLGIFLLVTSVLGYFTVKRGYTNSKNGTPPPSTA